MRTAMSRSRLVTYSVSSLLLVMVILNEVLAHLLRHIGTGDCVPALPIEQALKVDQAVGNSVRLPPAQSAPDGLIHPWLWPVCGCVATLMNCRLPICGNTS
jgi:hypothetical protein